jgi:hypothetical protein
LNPISAVAPGLGPGVHVFWFIRKVVDGRVKPGQDIEGTIIFTSGISTFGVEEPLFCVGFFYRTKRIS